jgi:radical SAM superfamily enzyme YgiQ (UPF0313 family)
METMRVLLISSNTEKITVVPLPLGVAFVAAAARKAGHHVELIDLMGKEDDREAIRKEISSVRPDVIGISVRNIDDQNMEKPSFLLDKVKRVVEDCRCFSSVPIVLGGAGYSIFPESALEYLGADMGIQGEGEEAFPSLLDRLQRGASLQGTPGLYLRGRGLQGRRKYVKRLDDVPAPDIPLPRGSPSGEEIWMPVQARRGCPMSCSYCSTPTIEGYSIRTRSPDAVIQEISRHGEAGIKHFHCVDNVFNLPPSYAKELCARLIDRNLEISWKCILYPGSIDGELADLLARAGCVEASLGFESGCERILRAMNKKFSLQAVRRASALLKRAGVRHMGFLLLGWPGETRESVDQTLAFADSLYLDALKITIGVRIYPFTALARTAREEGAISAGDDLLLPRFYCAGGIKDWLARAVSSWVADRPNLMIEPG